MKMTNKQMPKVGERYRNKHSNLRWKIVDICKNDEYITAEGYQKWPYETMILTREQFWNTFEPLPKPESKEKLPEVGREYRCKNLPNNCVYYTYKVHLIERREGDPGFRIQLITNIGNWLDRVSPAKFWEEYEEIPSTNKQEKSLKIPYDENILQSTGDSFIDYKCSCGNIIRLKIPYQKSLEVDKAKSIWKNVGELPEQNCHVIIQDYSDRYSIFECAEKRLTNILTGIYAREDKIVKKFCTLTDFINAFEDLQERVRKLEEKK